MLNKLTAHQTIWVLLLITFTTISAAWVFEYFGYLPCHLCLMQRTAYYIVVPISLFAALTTSQNQSGQKTFLIILGLVMLYSAGFGIFHSGVEWKLWAGPTTCTGDGGLTGGLPDLSQPAVMCDQAAIRILGLSLAGWNAVISAFCAWLAFAKVYGSRTASQ